MALRTQCDERERAQAVRQHLEGERIASWAALPAASGGRCVVHRHEVLNGSLNSPFFYQLPFYQLPFFYQLPVEAVAAGFAVGGQLSQLSQLSQLRQLRQVWQWEAS